MMRFFCRNVAVCCVMLCGFLFISCEKMQSFLDDRRSSNRKQGATVIAPIEAVIVENEGLSLAGAVPVFYGEIVRSTDIDELFIMADAGKSLELVASSPVIIDPYTISYNGWTYAGNYPIIIEPIVYADSIVVFDGFPAVAVLDKASGALISYVESTVFPSGRYGVHTTEKWIAFEGRNGKCYAYVFVGDGDDGVSVDGLALKSVESVGPVSFLKPSPTAMESLSFHVSRHISNARLSTEFYALDQVGEGQAKVLVSPVNVSIFAYYPSEGGEYTIGLCDKDGYFVEATYYVGIFATNGDLLVNSVDYVADKPLVTLTLNEHDIYYVAVAPLTDSVAEGLHIIAKKGSL